MAAPPCRTRNARRGGSQFAAVASASGRCSPIPAGAVAARATVTRDNSTSTRLRVDPRARLSGGRRCAAAPSPSGNALTSADWPRYLDALPGSRVGDPRRVTGKRSPEQTCDCAKATASRRERAYPCGAGGGYFSVSAEGRWYACHRASGHDYELGDNNGLDRAKRRNFSSAPRRRAGRLPRLLGALSLLRAAVTRRTPPATNRPATSSAAGWSSAFGPTAI